MDFKHALPRIVISILLVSFLFACAGGSNIVISKQDLVAIKSISINPDVVVPELPYVQGINMRRYGWLGGIGAAAGAHADSKIFQSYLDDNKIEISEIVLNCFKDAIAQKELFKITDSHPIQLKLQVNTYGFGVAGVFDQDNVTPLINISASLISADGTKTIWKKTDYIVSSSELTKYPIEQLIKEPDLTKRSLAEAAKIVTELIISELVNT